MILYVVFCRENFIRNFHFSDMNFHKISPLLNDWCIKLARLNFKKYRIMINFDGFWIWYNSFATASIIFLLCWSKNIKEIGEKIKPMEEIVIYCRDNQYILNMIVIRKWEKGSRRFQDTNSEMNYSKYSEKDSGKLANCCVKFGKQFWQFP